MNAAVPGNSHERTLSPDLLWVRDHNGRPAIRWLRVLTFAAAVITFNAATGYLFQRMAEVPLNIAAVLAPTIGLFAYLIVAVELQRQRVMHGTWSWRLGLAATMLLVVLAACFCGVTANSLRTTKASADENVKLAEQLEGVIQGGHAWVGSLDGGNITCQITRKSFSDADLAELVRLSTSRRSGRCELTTLILDGTAITSTGLKELSACERLTLLSLPSFTPTDEAIEAISRCERLETLLLDESRLTSAQLALLRKQLPKVRLNGMQWQERW